MKCNSATVAFMSAEPRIIAPNVLALDIPAAPGEPVTMELRFGGTPGKAATRPFAPGLVGEVKTRPLADQEPYLNSIKVKEHA